MKKQDRLTRLVMACQTAQDRVFATSKTAANYGHLLNRLWSLLSTLKCELEVLSAS